MLKPDKRCLVCQAVRKDKKLLQRIYDSKQFVKGGESLKQIARDYEGELSYQSLYNHCRTHQGLSVEDIEDKRLARTAKEIEAQQLRKVVKHQEMRTELLDIGMTGIREGDIYLKGSDVVSLLKQQADIEEKQKDREWELAKMIQDFASGAITEVIPYEGEFTETDHVAS